MEQSIQEKPVNFVITHDKGILTFKHKDRGTATYNINTGQWVHHAIKPSKMEVYFHHFQFSGKSSSWRTRCDYYRTVINDDFLAMNDKPFGEFIVNSVFKHVCPFTHRDSRNPAYALKHLKSFENNLHWNLLGIKTEALIGTNPSEVSKDVLRLLKANNWKFEKDFITDRLTLFEDIVKNLDTERIHNKYENDRTFNGNWFQVIDTIAQIEELIKLKYEVRDILRYLFNYVCIYENMSITDAITHLKDYARMQNLLGVVEYKKYPKFLRSNHDIVTGEYNRMKRTISEELFAKRIKPELEFENTTFIVRVPKHSDDLKDEGKQLSHCVAGYVDRILNGETQIVFLRKEPTKSLVTLEIRDNVLIQAKGYANRNITSEERKYIETYANHKNLLVRV